MLRNSRMFEAGASLPAKRPAPPRPRPRPRPPPPAPPARAPTDVGSEIVRRVRPRWRTSCSVLSAALLAPASVCQSAGVPTAVPTPASNGSLKRIVLGKTPNAVASHRAFLPPGPLAEDALARLAVEDGGGLAIEDGGGLAVEDGGILAVEDGGGLAVEDGGSALGRHLASHSGGAIDLGRYVAPKRRAPFLGSPLRVKRTSGTAAKQNDVHLRYVLRQTLSLLSCSFPAARTRRQSRVAQGPSLRLMTRTFLFSPSHVLPTSTKQARFFSN